MAGRRSALVIANDSYQDPGLQRLRAPVRDADALARVLGDPAIGNFEVQLKLNLSESQVRRQVAAFFSDRRLDDLLLLHFSCHGVKDADGQLYFAAADTELPALEATGVPSEFVNRQMTKCRSRRILLLLDCCYSGAFARGMTARADKGVDVRDQLGGHGRAVITASSSMEYAFEGDALTELEEAPSVFTSAVVRGLETGDADGNRDGYITVEELYQYVYDEVRNATPNQRPRLWTFDLEDRLVIARAARARPAELPGDIQEALQSQFQGARAEAVSELARLAQGQHRGLALAATMALQRLAATDDSLRVRTLAGDARPPARARQFPPPSPLPGSPTHRCRSPACR